MTLSDKTTKYDPLDDLLLNYPSWYVTTANFGDRLFSHIVVWPEKFIVVDPARFCSDRAWALTHMLYHLEAHMERLDSLTVEDCEQADYIAKVRLDRECYRSPAVNKEPTSPA